MALNHVQQLTGSPVLSTKLGSGRLLAGTDGSAKSSKHLDDTVRVDPLDGFKKYRGGYDITSKHYWSSTVFTGIPGYAIAVIWLLCGIGYGGFLLVVRICCKGRGNHKKRLSCHRQCYLWLLLLSALFTLLVVVACGLVLGGNAKFHSRAKTVIDIIINTADDASTTIYNATGAMKEMNLSLGGVSGSSEATRFLTSTSRKLNDEADDIERQASKNRRLIDKGIKIVYIVTTVTISLTLAAVIALLIFVVLKFPRTVKSFIAICWTFAVLCWLFFGIYLFLKNFAGDTCTALESFRENPYDNSLSSILPCDELLSAKSVLNDVSAGIYDLVNEVNRNISTSYGNIIQICNPFSPPPSHEYQPWNCSDSSIQIGKIPEVLRLVACPDIEGETCNGGILIPANSYNTIEAYSSSIQKLLDIYPDMENLVECQTVKDAFSEILENHCRPLKRYVRMVWSSLVFLSVVMVALVLVCTIGAHHEGGHHSSDGSVKPQQSTTVDIMESGTAKKDNSKPGQHL